MKKTTKKSKASKHEIVVRVEAPAVPAIKEADLGPEKEGSKLMIPKTWMSDRQVLKMVQRTPAEHVYTRPAKGGGTWQYVTGNYVEKVLNFTFGWNWDFEVTSHGREGDQVWVLGKLTVKDSKSQMSIVKTQFGRADIKFKKGSKEMLDYGNDLKSATTDALKKCASLLGIASDIYGKMEFKDLKPEVVVTGAPVVQTPVNVVQKPGHVIGPDGKPTFVCKDCDTPITDEVADYSQKVFGKKLCREHQPKKK